MDGLSQLEQLEVIVTTQDFLLSESVGIAIYLEDEGNEVLRFEKTKYGLGCKRVSSLS